MEAKTIDVILTALIQTDYETYTHVYKSVPVEIPNDGIDWHVAEEEHKEKRK